MDSELSICKTHASWFRDKYVTDPCKKSPCEEISSKVLTSLMLECWQREYDKRPYKKLIVNRNFFLKRFKREFTIYDFSTVLHFLRFNNKITFFELSYIDVMKDVEDDTIKKFTKYLKKIYQVNLINSYLPEKLFFYLFAEGLDLESKTPMVPPPSLSVSNVTIKESMFTVLDSTANIQSMCGVKLGANIEILRLCQNNLTLKQIKFLRCFILTNNNIKYLDLSCCSLTPWSYTLVINGIARSTSLLGINLSRLVLNDNDQACSNFVDTTKIASVIAQLIWKNKLTEIHFRQCELNSFDLEPIVEYIPQSILKIIDFSGNHIGPDGCELLLKAIIKAKYVEMLDISYNPLGSIGGEIVAHLLPYTRLIRLSIAHCSITQREIELIFYTIKKPVLLKQLYIWGNKFSAIASKTFKRQLVATVLDLKELDIDVTYDINLEAYRVVPQIKNDLFFSDFV